MEKRWQENLCENLVESLVFVSGDRESLKIAGESDRVAVLSQKFPMCSPVHLLLSISRVYIHT